MKSKFTIKRWRATMKDINPKFIDHEIESLEQLIKDLEQLLVEYPGGREHRIVLDLLIDTLDFKLEEDKYVRR